MFGISNMWLNPFQLLNLFLVLGTVFWTWMLLQAVREPEPVDRVVWVVILVGAPYIGCAVYFFARYCKRNPAVMDGLKRAILWPRTAGRTPIEPS